MKPLIGLLVFLLSGHLLAQTFDLNNRKSGVLFTNSGDSITGEIVLSSDYQSIYFIQGSSMRQLASIDFLSFKITTLGDFQFFVSLPKQLEGPHFIFEQLTDGSINLLCQQVDGTKYFYQFPDGMVNELTGDIFKIFGKHRKTMKDYAFSHALNVEEHEDLVQVFDYFNSIIAD